jgi:hypothetical protein
VRIVNDVQERVALLASEMAEAEATIRSLPDGGTEFVSFA